MSAHLDSLLLVLASTSALVLGLGYLSIFWQLSRKPRSSEPFFVTILKPLKGVDEGLLDNLRAIAAQDHPYFEVIFGAEEEDDPALAVARTVAAEYPHVPIRIVSGSWPTGLNPKVRILRHLQSLARHRWLLISDSNVRPPKDYLQQMCRTQRHHQADLVHSLLAGAHAKSLGGRLEELQLNGWVSASICLSAALGHSCVIGKSMLVSQGALASVGGLSSVEDILAEDYILGAKLERAGKKVAVCSQLLPVVTGRASLRQFLNRHVRWGQMRRRISPGFYVAELLGNPTLFFLALFFLGPDSLKAKVAVAQLLKWAADSIVYFRLSRSPSLWTLTLMPLKDLLVAGMWGVSAVKRTVNWRGRRMLVAAGSQLLPIDPQPSEHSARPTLWATRAS